MRGIDITAVQADRGIESVRKALASAEITSAAKHDLLIRVVTDVRPVDRGQK
jgi:hypothetical protein